jgi:hypothetical protein
LSLGERLERRPSLLGSLVQLVFDSALQPVPAGVRGGGGERRLLFEIGKEAGEKEACQLDLRLRREESGTVEILGQLLPPTRGGSVRARAARTRREARLGESGEFLLRGLPAQAASFRLEITRPDRTSITIEEVPMPASRNRTPER